MRTPSIGDNWYRLQDVKHAPPLDEFERPIGEGELKVHLKEFVVIKVTPKGVKLSQKFGDFCAGGERFVRLNATKKFACPTIKEAKESFLTRKKKELKIYLARSNRAEKSINIVQEMYNNDETSRRS